MQKSSLFDEICSIYIDILFVGNANLALPLQEKNLPLCNFINCEGNCCRKSVKDISVGIQYNWIFSYYFPVGYSEEILQDKHEGSPHKNDLFLEEFTPHP